MTETRDLVIGLDFGSDSVRGVLIDARGKVLATCSCSYPRWNDGKWRDDSRMMYRQHPLDYFEAMTQVVRAITSDVERTRIAAISLDTTGSTPSALRSDGAALALDRKFADDPDAMFVLWKDHTAIEEAESINRAAAECGVEYLDYCGGTYSEEWFFSKVLRIVRHAPHVAAAAASYAECGDYIAGELAGITAPCRMARNRCAAAHKAMWNAKWGGLPDKAFLERVDPRLGAVRDKLYADTVYGLRVSRRMDSQPDALGRPLAYLERARWQQRIGQPRLFRGGSKRMNLVARFTNEIAHAIPCHAAFK